MLPNAATGSSKNIEPNRLIATSKPPAGNWCTWASACWKLTFVSPSSLLTRRACSSICADRSMPSALPATAARAASLVDRPVPQPMSSTRSPRPTPVAARNRSLCGRVSASNTAACLARCAPAGPSHSAACAALGPPGSPGRSAAGSPGAPVCRPPGARDAGPPGASDISVTGLPFWLPPFPGCLTPPRARDKRFTPARPAACQQFAGAAPHRRAKNIRPFPAGRGPGRSKTLSATSTRTTMNRTHV